MNLSNDDLMDYLRLVSANYHTWSLRERRRILDEYKTNTETKYVRGKENIATDVQFDEVNGFKDREHALFTHISKRRKLAEIMTGMTSIASSTGYRTGSHIWHIKSHSDNNCALIGIAENKAPYYGPFTSDDYSGHWRVREKNNQPPYICAVINGKEYYTKDVKIRRGDSRWRRGDIISIKLNFGVGTRRSIEFLKNGQPVCSPISVVKDCTYYPTFYWFRRGTYEIIDNQNVEKELMYQARQLRY